MALNQSLENSNKVIANDNARMCQEIEAATQDPMTAARARIWESLIKNILSAGIELTDYIDALKGELGKGSLEISKKEQELLNRLEGYKKKILYDLDTAGFKNMPDYVKENLINRQVEFNKMIPIFPNAIRERKSEASVTQNYFDENILENSPSLEAMLKLNKLKNDVLLSENMLANYCNDQWPRADCGFRRYYAVAVIKSTYVKAGEENEVTAGMGSFNDDSKPIISINNTIIPLSPDGVSVYRFKAFGKPGKHRMLVNIKFTDTNGQPATLTKIIEYHIAE